MTGLVTARRLTKEAVVLGGDRVIVVACPAVLGDPHLQTVGPEAAQGCNLAVRVHEFVQVGEDTLHVQLSAQHAHCQC